MTYIILHTLTARHTDLSPEEVTKALELDKLKDKLWYVVPSVATQGTGIFEGLVSSPVVCSPWLLLTFTPLGLALQQRQDDASEIDGCDLQHTTRAMRFRRHYLSMASCTTTNHPADNNFLSSHDRRRSIWTPLCFSSVVFMPMLSFFSAYFP